MNVYSNPGRVVALVPTWNAEAFIEDTLRSLSCQTYSNLRVLISDDASTDNTVTICEAFVAEDSRFRVIRQPRNLGWIGNVNELMRRARGDFFVFAFHDDLLLPDYITRVVARLEENSEAVLAFSDIEVVHQDGRTEDLTFQILDGVRGRVDRGLRMIAKPANWWIPHRGVFRSTGFERIGGLKTHLDGESLADWPWLLHLSLLGEFERVPEVLCRKVYKEQSVSRAWRASMWSRLAVSLSCAREIRGTDLPGRERLLLYRRLVDTVWRWNRDKWLRQLTRLVERF